MHIYTNAQGFPPGRVDPLSRSYLARLMSISDADERRDLDKEFVKEDKDYDSDIDDEGGLFPMI